MSDNNVRWYHLNQYNALAACEHCQGVIRHEPWCMCAAPAVWYAYEVVADPSKLTMGDALMLHALGVVWDDKPDTSDEHPCIDAGLPLSW